MHADHQQNSCNDTAALLEHEANAKLKDGGSWRADRNLKDNTSEHWLKPGYLDVSAAFYAQGQVKVIFSLRQSHN
jgi:hypothetical protein